MYFFQNSNSLDELKQWYSFKIKPFKTKFKIRSLKTFNFKKFFSEIGIVSNKPRGYERKL